MSKHLPQDWDVDLSTGITSLLILTSLGEGGRRAEGSS